MRKMTDEEICLGMEIERWVDADVIHYREPSARFICALETQERQRAYGSLAFDTFPRHADSNILEIPLSKAIKLYRDGELKQYIETELAIHLIKHGG